MLTTQNWERRLRRELNKYGCHLHKIRGKAGEYTVTSDETDDERYFSSLLKVQGFAEYLRERYAN